MLFLVCVYILYLKHLYSMMRSIYRRPMCIGNRKQKQIVHHAYIYYQYHKQSGFTKRTETNSSLCTLPAKMFVVINGLIQLILGSSWKKQYVIVYTDDSVISFYVY